MSTPERPILERKSLLVDLALWHAPLLLSRERWLERMLAWRRGPFYWWNAQLTFTWLRVFRRRGFPSWWTALAESDPMPPPAPAYLRPPVRRAEAPRAPAAPPPAPRLGAPAAVAPPSAAPPPRAAPRTVPPAPRPRPPVPEDAAPPAWRSPVSWSGAPSARPAPGPARLLGAAPRRAGGAAPGVPLPPPVRPRTTVVHREAPPKPEPPRPPAEATAPPRDVPASPPQGVARPAEPPPAAAPPPARPAGRPPAPIPLETRAAPPVLPDAPTASAAPAPGTPAVERPAEIPVETRAAPAEPPPRSIPPESAPPARPAYPPPGVPSTPSRSAYPVFALRPDAPRATVPGSPRLEVVPGMAFRPGRWLATGGTTFVFTGSGVARGAPRPLRGPVPTLLRQRVAPPQAAPPLPEEPVQAAPLEPARDREPPRSSYPVWAPRPPAPPRPSGTPPDLARAPALVRGTSRRVASPRERVGLRAPSPPRRAEAPPAPKPSRPAMPPAGPARSPTPTASPVAPRAQGSQVRSTPGESGPRPEVPGPPPAAEGASHPELAPRAVPAGSAPTPEPAGVGPDEVLPEGAEVFLGLAAFLGPFSAPSRGRTAWRWAGPGAARALLRGLPPASQVFLRSAVEQAFVPEPPGAAAEARTPSVAPPPHPPPGRPPSPDLHGVPPSTPRRPSRVPVIPAPLARPPIPAGPAGSGVAAALRRAGVLLRGTPQVIRPHGARGAVLTPPPERGPAHRAEPSAPAAPAAEAPPPPVSPEVLPTVPVQLRPEGGLRRADAQPLLRRAGSPVTFRRPAPSRRVAPGRPRALAARGEAGSSVAAGPSPRRPGPSPSGTAATSLDEEAVAVEEVVAEVAAPTPSLGDALPQRRLPPVVRQTHKLVRPRRAQPAPSPAGPGQPPPAQSPSSGSARASGASGSSPSTSSTSSGPESRFVWEAPKEVVQRPVVRTAPEPPVPAARGGRVRELPPEKQILEILRLLATEDPVARSLLNDVREQVAEMLRFESMREW